MDHVGVKLDLTPLPCLESPKTHCGEIVKHIGLEPLAAAYIGFPNDKRQKPASMKRDNPSNNHSSTSRTPQTWYQFEHIKDIIFFPFCLCFFTNEQGQSPREYGCRL